MLNFKTDNNKVIVTVEHGIYYNSQYFEMSIQQAFDYQAQLLKQQLNKHLNDELKRLKRKYYYQGWKDKASKKVQKKKFDDFFGGWEK